MVAAEKWSQNDIDSIFSLKYDQGWSEPMITDYVALHFPSHRNVKVAGIRYVLRSKRPSDEKFGDKNKLEKKLPSTQNSNDQIRPQTPQTVTNLPKISWIQRQQRIAKQNENKQGLMAQEKLQQQFVCQMNHLVMLPQSVPFDRKQDQQSQHVAPLPSFDQNQALQREIPILSHQAAGSFEKQNFDNRKKNPEQLLQLPEKNIVASLVANSQKISSTKPLKAGQLENFTTECLKNDVFHKALAACDERFRKSIHLLEHDHNRARMCLQEEIDRIIQTDKRLKNFEYSFRLAGPCLKELEAEHQKLVDQEKNERMFLEITHNQEIATLITELDQCNKCWNKKYQVPVDGEQLDAWGQRPQGQIQPSPDHHIQKGEVIEQEYLPPFLENKKSPNILSSDMLSEEEFLPGSRLIPQDVQGDFSKPRKTGRSNEVAEKLAVNLQMKDHGENIDHSIDLKAEDLKMIGQQASCSISSFDGQTEVANQDFLSSTYFSDSTQSYNSVFPSLKDYRNDFATESNNIISGTNSFSCMEQPQVQEVVQNSIDDHNQNLNNSLSQTVFNGTPLNSYSEIMNMDENGDGRNNFLNLPCSSTQASTLQNTTLNGHSISSSDTSQSCCSDIEYSGLSWDDKCKILSKQLPNYRVDKRRSTETNLKKQKQKVPRQMMTSVKKNRFGGIKGPPVARFGPSVSNYDNSLDPLCHASLYEDDNSDLKPQRTRSTQHQDSQNSNIDISANSSSYQHPEFVASSARNRMLLPEYSISAPALDTIINLHNPEFHQHFDMPLDAHNWVADKCGVSSLTLHGRTLNGQVTINMISPKFHSGLQISGVPIIPEHSQELINCLTEGSNLSDGIKKMKSLIKTEQERYCGKKTNNGDLSQADTVQLHSSTKPEESGDHSKMGKDLLSNSSDI